jgi:hypothetical protein
MTPVGATELFEIFASYSHLDARFVKPLLAYLRPTGAAVFRDEDAIQPGRKWATVIADAIEACRVMYLFWCHHSASSDEVRKEYEKAIGLHKDIVPVLLDDTPLPPNLQEYQWVDFRVVIGKHEDVVEQSISLSEGRERQRVDREARGDDKGRWDTSAGYFGGGTLQREGWTEHEGRYVRTLVSPRDIPDAALHQAAQLLSANLETRLKPT